MCSHEPRCPSAGDTARGAARVIVGHPEQGWSLLCNGIVLFDDGGLLLPDGRAEGAPRSQNGPPSCAPTTRHAGRRPERLVGRPL